MMNELEFKKTIAMNISKYRKINGLTQAEFAEKLNYSDKAISKWERGESIPDTYTLSIIADLFGVTLNELCSNNNEVKPIHKKKPTHVFILLLSIGLVWLVATVIFTILLTLLQETYFRPWMMFIIALPIMFIVSTVFTVLWFNNFFKGLSVSLLIWSIALTLDITIPFEQANLFYVIAIPLQILIIIWYIMKTFLRRKN
mgnify:CR=1 FL=1